MLGIGSLIGSGWLFGAWEASKIAGPAAILSWIVGVLVIGIIAYNYAELGTMLPTSGSMSKFATYSHGNMLGFMSSWANWISLVAIIPIEAIAAVQYMASWPWSWAKYTRKMFDNGTITIIGLFAVFTFIIIFTLINYWSVSFLLKFTSFISLFKIIVPILTIVVLSLSGFHPQNYGSSFQEFMPYGSSSIFAATTSAGIIFSFNAFQTVINMGTEVKRPSKNITLGIFLSLLISAIIYILLQSTFITSISPGIISKYGWNGINMNSPFADLAILLGVYWLSVLLYIDAFISPFGTGVSFVASAGRALSAMTESRHIPKFLGKINHKYNIPRVSMVVNAILSILLVSIFRSWATLASVISTSTLISYLTGPIVLVSLRKMGPNFKRPMKVKSIRIIPLISFLVTSLAIYWGMWPTTIKVIGIITLGLPIYIFYEFKIKNSDIKKDILGCAWFIAYLIFISLVSYVGSSDFNGQNLIKYPWDFLVIIIGSVIFYAWGIRSYEYTSSFENAKKINKKMN